MEKTNTILDDICVDIGYSATNALVGWFGGEYLSVPESISREHPIARAIGGSPASRLAVAWGGKRVWIPLAHGHGVDRRDKHIAVRLAAGAKCSEISIEVGLTERRVQQIRLKLEHAGMVDFLRENSQEKTPQENSPGKTPQESGG